MSKRSLATQERLRAPLHPIAEGLLPVSPEWREREAWHMTHAATPLNANTLRATERRPYVIEALNYVNEVLGSAVANSQDLSPQVFGHLEIAVQSAVFSRIEENERKTIPVDCDDETAELFARACLGVGSPDELLSLLSRHPEELRSLELAKQTNPCDWLGTEQMDETIESLLRQKSIVRESDRAQNVRYALTRVDSTSNASTATFIRKADRGIIRGPKASIAVVQRDSLIIDLTNPDTALIRDHMMKWLRQSDTQEQLRGDTKVPYGGRLLHDFVAEQFATEASRRSPSLIPAVRSYYAHVL